MKKLGFLSFVLCVFLNVACAQAPEKRPKVEQNAFDKKLTQLLQFTVPLIGVQELHDIQDEVFIFDTRKQEEYAVSHIARARYLGYEDFDERRLKDVPKDAKIVLYCSVGYRSEKIGERLQKAGFTKVYNLYGSIFEWLNQGFPVVDEQGKPMKKVHTYNRDWSKWMHNDTVQKVW